MERETLVAPRPLCLWGADPHISINIVLSLILCVYDHIGCGAKVVSATRAAMLYDDHARNVAELERSVKCRPSPNDEMLNYQEAVNSEDRCRVASWEREALKDPTVRDAIQRAKQRPSRTEMLQFAQNSNWQVALASPAAKDAMRRIKHRVMSLKEEGMAIANQQTVTPNVGHRLLNAPVKVQVKQEFFMTGKFNPLEASHPQRGWDPSVIQWPGRKIGDIGAKREPTSFWCESWGGCASDKGLDTGYHCVRPQDITPEARRAKAELHTRGWR